MSSVEHLRELVNERLAVAAEEIFVVFKKTIVEYEEEIHRQRKLLEIFWKPTVYLHRIELPEQHVYMEEEEEEEVVTDQQHCIQQRSSSLDHEEPTPPQIKEEPEELCTSQEDLMLTPTYEESDHSDDQSLNLSIDQIQAAIEEKPLSYFLAESSEVAEQSNSQQLLSHSSHKAESRHGDTRSKTDAVSWKHHKSKRDSNNVLNSPLSEIHYRTVRGKQPIRCDICGKFFKFFSQFSIHMRFHTGERPYMCNTCGKSFCNTSGLNTHIKIHTGEKPFVCNTCGKGFIQRVSLTAHERIHTGEKPYSCKTCGKSFRFHSGLLIHIKTHTEEKSCICRTCGKIFSGMTVLKKHTRIHASENPVTFKTLET